jgi:PAS domain S-box-containing protein
MNVSNHKSAVRANVVRAGEAGRAIGEPLLDRMLVLYGGFYLALLGVALRGVSYYFTEEVQLPEGTTVWADGHEYRWLVVGLLAGFAVLATLRNVHPARNGPVMHAYLAAQAGIVVSLLLIEPRLDYFAVLFFLLSMQAMLWLPLRRGYSWIALFVVLTAICLAIGENGFQEGILLAVLYAGGYYFFGSFAALTVMSERAREETQRAYAELSEREVELLESEERYHRVVEGSPEIVMVSDGAGRIIDVNQSACVALGYQRSELVGLSLEDVCSAHRGEHAAKVHHTIETGEVDAKPEEALMRRKDGKEFPAEGQLVSIELKGQPHVLVLARDITERQAAQEAQFRHARELAKLDERNRVARDIHDTLAQSFTGVVLQLEAAEQALADDRKAVGAHLTSAKNLAREGLQEARRSVQDLRPQALSSGSLEKALRLEVERTRPDGRQGSLRVSGETRLLLPSVEDCLLRVCQESLTNVSRHAAATNVWVDLRYETDSLLLSIRDDGAGFDPEVAAGNGGFGLRGMQERLALLGGSLSISSRPGGGTTIEARVPIGHRAE